MVTVIELGVFVLAVLLLVFGRQILSSLRALTANAVGGVVTLFAASWLGFGVALSPLTLVITALAGIPGAVLILLLAYGNVAFVPPGVENAGNILANRALENFDQLVEGGSKFVEFVNESSNESGSETSIDG